MLCKMSTSPESPQGRHGREMLHPYSSLAFLVLPRDGGETLGGGEGGKGDADLHKCSRAGAWAAGHVGGEGGGRRGCGGQLVRLFRSRMVSTRRDLAIRRGESARGGWLRKMHFLRRRPRRRGRENPTSSRISGKNLKMTHSKARSTFPRPSSTFS